MTYQQLRIQIITKIVEDGMKNDIPNDEIQRVVVFVDRAMRAVHNHYEAILAEKNKIW